MLIFTNIGSILHPSFFMFQEPISKAQGDALSKDIGAIGYFETSALANTGVDSVFQEAARRAFKIGGARCGQGGYWGLLCDSIDMKFTFFCLKKTNIIQIYLL